MNTSDFPSVKAAKKIVEQKIKDYKKMMESEQRIEDEFNAISDESLQEDEQRGEHLNA